MTSPSALDSGSLQVTPAAGLAEAAIGVISATRTPTTTTRTDRRIDGLFVIAVLPRADLTFHP
jgi:hypothetical protein